MEYNQDVQKRVQSAWATHKQGRGVSQVAAAKALGMNQSAFSQYIRGTIPLNTDFLRKFAALTDIDPVEFGLQSNDSGSVPSRPVKVMATLSGREPKEKSQLVESILENNSCYFVEVDYNDYSLPKGSLLLVNPEGTIREGDTVIYFKGLGEPTVFGQIEETEEGWELLEQLWQGGRRYLVDKEDHVYRVSSLYYPSQGRKHFK